MPTIMTQGNSEGMRRCDATCHRAKRPHCDCICGGRYHGRGDEYAREQLTQDWLGDDWRETKAAVEAAGGSFVAHVEAAIQSAVRASQLPLLFLLALLVAGAARATVITGEITGYRESAPSITFGGLSAWYSTAQGGVSGWFYGSQAAGGNTVDVFNAGLIDPLEVTQAERFNYSTRVIEAFEGQTVFFRGRNGLYGAWVLDDFAVVPCPVGCPFGTVIVELAATWYVQDAGGGNFRAGGPPVPEPSGALLFAVALLVARTRRRERSVLVLRRVWRRSELRPRDGRLGQIGELSGLPRPRQHRLRGRAVPPVHRSRPGARRARRHGLDLRRLRRRRVRHTGAKPVRAGT